MQSHLTPLLRLLTTIIYIHIPKISVISDYDEKVVQTDNSYDSETRQLVSKLIINPEGTTICGLDNGLDTRLVPGFTYTFRYVATGMYGCTVDLR